MTKVQEQCTAMVMSAAFWAAVVREPVFVKCRGCEHEWIGMYTPMHITRAASILQGMRCPNCGNDSASIFIKAKEADG